MSIVYSFFFSYYSLNPMMHLNSLRDSKSPNPQWRTNEKGSRIIIVPPFVNTHFVSLLLYTVLYVDVTSSCYMLCSISHACTSILLAYLSILYFMCLYLSIICILLHVLIFISYLLLVCYRFDINCFCIVRGSQNKCNVS